MVSGAVLGSGAGTALLGMGGSKGRLGVGQGWSGRVVGVGWAELTDSVAAGTGRVALEGVVGNDVPNLCHAGWVRGSGWVR